MTIRIFLGVSALLLVAPDAWAAARFVPLGQALGAANPNSATIGVSADGSVVAGTIGNEQGAFRWTEQTGMVVIGGDAFGHQPRNATAVSGDGMLIVGELLSGGVYKWSQSGGLELLPPRLSGTAAISYDGSNIFPQINLFHPYGGSIRDVSWDGSTIVGDAYFEGYRDRGGVRTWIGDLPGGDYWSYADAVSADGEMIVGSSKGSMVIEGQLTNSELPIYWTAAGGIVPLGGLSSGVATDVSRSKIVIVGQSGNPSENLGLPFRWTPATGTKVIEELLLAEGIDIAAQGWILGARQQIAVSADGRIITGAGRNPGGNIEPWLVELSIPGDFDDDGDSDGNDFLNWQRGVGSTYDEADFADWRTNVEFVIGLQSPTAAATVAVPEPTAAVVVAVPALLSLFRRRSGQCRTNR